MMKNFLLLGAIVAMVGVVPQSARLSAQTSDWPTIQALHETYTFTYTRDTTDTPVLAFIKDDAGAPRYKLECHSGGYDDDSETNYSGDLQCVLFALDEHAKPITVNLLAVETKNEQSSSWWNRGRMLSSQLRGRCLSYPEYSTDRHFKLRGMLMSLRFSSVVWSEERDTLGSPLIKKFVLHVDAVPDKAAVSSTAELPQGPEPPTSCYP